MEPRVNSAAGRCAITHCAKLCRVPAGCGVKMSPSLSRTCPPTARVIIGWITPFEGPAGTSLPQRKVRHRWPVEAGDRAGVMCTITALYWSQNRIMETSFAVCRGSEWRTHWIHVSLTICTVKLLIQTLCWSIFLSRASAHVFLCKLHVPALIRRVDTRGAL